MTTAQQKREWRARKAGFTSYEDYKMVRTQEKIERCKKIARLPKHCTPKKINPSLAIWKSNGITKPWVSADITEKEYYNWLGKIK